MTDGERAGVVAGLVEEHYELLYRFAYRLSGSTAEAEDLTQQAFLTAQRKLDQLRDPGKARSWLLSIVRNGFLKGKRRPRFTEFESFEHLPEAPIEPLDGLSGPVGSEDLQAVLNEMPEEFRTPIILHYFQEQTYAEIAEQMETPLGTVMSRLYRARQYLRSRLLERLGEEAPAAVVSKT